MSVTAQIQYIAEKLEAPEQNLVLEFMIRLLPDDVATAEDIRDITLARQELAKGDVVDFNDINWN